MPASPVGQHVDRRVLIGGSWNNTSDNCRAAKRNKSPNNRNNNIGVHVLRPTPLLCATVQTNGRWVGEAAETNNKPWLG
jgi:hypothetical protein